MIKAFLAHISIILILYLLLFYKQSKTERIINFLLSICFFYLIYTFLPWSSYGSAYLKYLYGLFYLVAFVLSIKYARNIDKTEMAQVSTCAMKTN
jgi:hypothetical protein